jgi:hypothetical protein
MLRAMPLVIYVVLFACLREALGTRTTLYSWEQTHVMIVRSRVPLLFAAQAAMISISTTRQNSQHMQPKNLMMRLTCFRGLDFFPKSISVKKGYRTLCLLQSSYSLQINSGPVFAGDAVKRIWCYPDCLKVCIEVQFHEA